MTQCSTGRYNMLSNEESLSVYVVLKDEEGNVAEVDGVKAVLYYSGEASEEDEFRSAFPENLDFIFSKAFSYGSRVISSTDYRKQCLVFMKLYTENFETIAKQYEAEKKESIEREIASLERELESIHLPNCSAEFQEPLDEEATRYERWASEEEKAAADIKEGTELWNKAQEKITRYRDKAKKLREYIQVEEIPQMKGTLEKLNSIALTK